VTRWVVVGAGAAGCVVAARLSERSDDDVVVLEAGPDHGAEPVPGDVGPYLDDPRRLFVEHVVRRPGTDPEPYRQGFGLGGSSLVNASVVTGPVPPDLLLPLEDPWSDGPVGRALLVADVAARRVRLARRAGKRVTVADAYLRPVMDRANLTLLTDRRVERVTFDGRRATGVTVADGSTMPADRVVLCAGAIRTPTILLRSGVDTPGIGHGLQDHPAVTITLRLRPEAVDATSPTISVAARHDDHQVLALNHLPAVPDHGALTIGLRAVSGEGRVTLAGATGEPCVELAQLSDRRDLARLVAAVEATIELLGHPSWSLVVDGMYVDDRGTPLDSIAGSRELVEGWIHDHPGGHHHVSGTCREGVVLDGGRVHGYESLLVCDASALRGVPADDPYLTVVLHAERTVAGWR
jgi:choline dehydrogenase-like flavoprotein